MNHPAFTLTAFCMSCLSLIAAVFLFLRNLERSSAVSVSDVTPTSEESVSTSDDDLSPTLKKRVERIVDERIQNALGGRSSSSQTAGSPGLNKAALDALGSAATTDLSDNINQAVLKRVNQELENVDWEDQLSQERLMKLLKNATRRFPSRGSSRQNKRIDVSDCATTEEKVEKILAVFEGSRSYSHDNELVKQLREMGDEAITPLLAQLKNVSRRDWGKRMAITESLEGLLTEDYKDVILEEFKNNSHFPKLIAKYKFPEAEEMVFDKITYPTHGYLRNEIVDAALVLNESEAIPRLKKYIEMGQNPSYAAKRLANLPDVDITEELRVAAQRTNSSWQRHELSKIMLDKGMVEGLSLARAVLTSGGRNGHLKQQMAIYLQKYTDAKGNYEDMAAWVKENEDYLQWNEFTRRFE